MARNSIKKPWFGINPANMITPKIKPAKKEKEAGSDAKKKE